MHLSGLQPDGTVRTLDLKDCVNIDPSKRLEIIPCAPYGKDLITDDMKFIYSKAFNSFQTFDGKFCWTITPKKTVNLRDCKIRRGAESKQTWTFLMHEEKGKVVVAPSGKFAGECIGYKKVSQEKIRFRNNAHSVEIFGCDVSKLSVIY